MLLFEFLNLFTLNYSFISLFSDYDEDGYPVDDSTDDEYEDDDYYSDNDYDEEE